jgi:hypothetical protein
MEFNSIVSITYKKCGVGEKIATSWTYAWRRSEKKKK